MKLQTFATAALVLAQASAYNSLSKRSSSADTIVFQNVGYTGYYYDVAELSNADSEDCQCALSDSFTVFEGSNSPLNEALSVHFRGPLSLESFAVYTADDSSTGPWTRTAYYSASNQTATNVTFLNAKGYNSTCMGNALTYASSNGTGIADESTILEANNLLQSDEEIMIFSSDECPESGFDNSCGLYREGIPAYQGYSGTTKMFLFEFQMPEATTESWEYENMPAIWLLNAKIPRTSQYGNGSCSCWDSGCGEIDLFEIMNKTESTHLFSTIHDYQGNGDINNGMQADGYFERDTEGTMKGGVVFGTDGTISIFLSNSTEIADSLDASTVSSWLTTDDEVVDVLSSVTMDTSITTSSTSKTGSETGTKTASASATATVASTSGSSGGTINVSQSWAAAILSTMFSFMYI